MTSYYNNNSYSQYNSAFDQAVADRNSQIFWDAVSMTSSDRNSIAMSVYHSVPELRQDENAANRQHKNERVRRGRKAKGQPLNFLRRFHANNHRFSLFSFFIVSRFGSIVNLLISFSLTTRPTGKRLNAKSSSGTCSARASY